MPNPQIYPIVNIYINKFKIERNTLIIGLEDVLLNLSTEETTDNDGEYFIKEGAYELGKVTK